MTGTAMTVHTPQVGAAVARGPLDFDSLLRLAKELVPTGFLPDHIKNAGQCAAIILTGRELGMEPMRALRSLQMVKGKVIESADSQLARFKADGGRGAFAELTDTRAVLVLRHPNGDEHTESFTIEDAKRAQLLTNPSWQKYPRAMLRSRCITAGLKSLGWEGGIGNYDPDEASAFVVSHGGEAATGAQREILTALSKRVAVFTAEQCDSLSDYAADAMLSADHAADIIQKAEARIAKWEQAQTTPAAAGAE